MYAGEKVEIFNQVAETLKVRDLATLIAGKTGVEIRNLENPRKEDAENELQVCIEMVLWYAVKIELSSERYDYTHICSVFLTRMTNSFLNSNHILHYIPCNIIQTRLN